jgi:hypothetical protein
VPSKLGTADGCAVCINLPATFQFSPASKILHSRPLLALNEISFVCTIFLIFSAIVQDKSPFFTTFDYIVAVIQALQFVEH